MSEITLHPQLAEDCHCLGLLSSSLLLLHRNPALHWFILVPPGETLDLLDLPAAGREALLDDAGRVAGYLKASLAYPRVNVAALGLVVPQLHLHVVGRREGDACWPAPVWGRLQPSQDRYDEAELARLREALVRS
jgi:diadenosine tetraphosphate (Ap4A) HIT family hydrolase